MTKAVVLLCSVLALPACTQWKATARINPATIAVYPGGEGPKVQARNLGAPAGCPLTGGYSDGKRGAVNLDCFEFPEDTDDGQSAITPAYDKAVPRLLVEPAVDVDRNRARADAMIARNRLSAVLIKHADDVCVLEKGRLVATESSANFILSFLTQGLSGASSIVMGERAKSILSALATLASGTQNNVNATFYRNQLIQAINKTLDSERQKIMTQIVAARPRDIEAYNVDDMITMVNAYHQACSFERGLQVLLDAALDSTGAQAALQMRLRDAAIVNLQQHLAFLREQLRQTVAAGGQDEEVKRLQKEIADVVAQISGIRTAEAQKFIAKPSVGDVAEEHGTTASPPAPPVAPPVAPPIDTDRDSD